MQNTKLMNSAKFVLSVSNGKGEKSIMPMNLIDEDGNSGQIKTWRIY